MATTTAEISQWFDEMVAFGASHMVIVCDTFDWTDFPVGVMPPDTVEQVLAASEGPMYKVMEVYNLSMDKQQQLSEYRAWHP